MKNKKLVIIAILAIIIIAIIIGVNVTNKKVGDFYVDMCFSSNFSITRMVFQI